MTKMLITRIVYYSIDKSASLEGIRKVGSKQLAVNGLRFIKHVISTDGICAKRIYSFKRPCKTKVEKSCDTTDIIDRITKFLHLETQLYLVNSE